MKIINLTVGKNPPLIKMKNMIGKAVCYKLESTDCEITQADIDAQFPNQVRNVFITNDVPSWNPNQNLITYHIYKDESTFNPRVTRPITYIANAFGADLPPVPYVLRNERPPNFDITGQVTATNNLFKVIVPPLPTGYYYMDVSNSSCMNKVMLSVS